MKSVTRTIYQRVTSVASAFVLLVGTFTAFAPLFFSPAVGAAADELTVATTCENGRVVISMNGSNETGQTMWAFTTATATVAQGDTYAFPSPSIAQDVSLKTGMVAVPAGTATLHVYSDEALTIEALTQSLPYDEFSCLAKPTLLSPGNGSQVRSGNYVISWQAVANAGSYNMVASTENNAVDANGKLINTGPNVLTGIPSTVTSYDSVDLPDGIRYWQVQAVAANGVAGPWSDVWSLTVDDTAPQPVVVTPGASVKVSGVTPIYIETNDANTHYTYVEINQNGAWKTAQTFSGQNITWNFDTATLPDGNYTIKVNAIDYAGNGSETTRNFTIANPPVVTNVTPASGSTIRGTVTFRANVADANLSYTYMEWNKNGSWLTDNTKEPGSVNGGTAPTLVLDTTDYDDGLYQLKIDAVDGKGNTTEQILTYTVDNTAPVVAITSPTAGAYGNDNEVTVSATIGDATSYRILVNGSVVRDVTAAPFTDYVVNTSNGGTYVVAVEGVDAAGNIGSATVSFTIDNDGPGITTNLANDDVLAGFTTVTGAVTDGNNATYQLAIYSADDLTTPVLSSNNLSYTFNTALLLNGDYVALQSAQDEFGNRTTISTDFTILNIPVEEGEETETDTDTYTGTTNPDSATPTANVATPIITSPAAALIPGGNADVAGESTDGGDADVAGESTENVAAIDTDSSDGTVFNLAWYWWLLIIAGLAGLGALIAAIIRRNAAAQE
jgi:large repetitive protein